MDLAVREERILLTEDKDFGQLVYAHSSQSRGVMFIRYSAHARNDLPRAVADLVAEVGSELMTTFVVMSPGRVRIAGRRPR